MSPSDMWAVRDLAASAARRLTWLRLRHGVLEGLVLAAAMAFPVLLLLALTAFGLGRFPWTAAGATLGVCFGAGVLGGLLWAIAGRPSSLAAAKALDDACGLSDRVSSALLLASEPSSARPEGSEPSRAAPRFETVGQFWPHYLAAHRNRINRGLHVVGSLSALVWVGLAIAWRNPWLLPLAVLNGYGLAWIGHFVFEGNRPATFGHPVKSFICDWIMLGKVLTFRIGRDLAQIESDLESDLAAGRRAAFTRRAGAPGPGQQAARALLLRRAAETARTIDLARAFPRPAWRTPRWLAAPVSAALLLGVCLPFVDFAREASANEIDPAFIAAFRNALGDVSAELERTAEEIEREGDQTENPEGKRIGESLRKVAEDLRNTEPNDKRRAVQKVGRAIRRHEKEQLPLTLAEALKKAVAHLRKSKHTRAIAEQLEKDDYAQAANKADELGEKLPGMKLDPEEAAKLHEAAGSAAQALAGTELKQLAEKLARIAEALREGDQMKAGEELKGLAQELEKLKNMPGTQRMLGKALDALRKSRDALAQAGRGGRSGQKMPFADLKMPPGAHSKGADGGKAQPFPVLPGPIRPGGQGGGGAGGGPQQLYKGPCAFDCDFEGQCIKCPCRGKQNCPKSKRKDPSPCECRTCIAFAGGGGGQGGAGAQMPGQGQGGLPPGWGSQRNEQEPSERKGRARRTRLNGIIGEKGESAVMAVKSANDGSRAGVEYRDVYSDYRRVAEESLYRDEIPLSKRDHVRRYFDSIKPREDD